MLNREPYSATGQHSCHTAVENDVCLGTPKLQAEPQLQHTQPSISNDVTSQKWFRQLIALMLNGVGQSTLLSKAMKYLLIVNLKEYYARSALLGYSFVMPHFYMNSITKKSFVILFSL